jgi:single-strand DNA-binding protein
MKVIGLARLGRDAEVRTTQGGEQVASLSLAFTRRVKGEKLTDWVDGALWGKRAEALAQYLTKGSLVVVTLDDVHIETYQGKNGEGNKLVGRVTDVELAGGGGERAAAPAPAKQQGGGYKSDAEADIPFAPMAAGRAFLAV